MTINCKFCNQQAHYKPIEEMERFGVRVYFCDFCKAEYLVWNNGTIGSISLYTIINEKTYRWTDNLKGINTLWYVKDPGNPGTRVNKNLECIFSFTANQVKPNITPDNIREKIKNYILIL